MAVFPAPAINKPAAPATTPSNKAPLPLVPFTRAARSKSMLIGQYGPYTLGAAQIPLPAIQVRPAGFLARLVLKVIGTTSANAATVAFKPDAPFNVLQQIAFLSPQQDTILSSIDGFTLAMIDKYFALGTGFADPLADPFFSKVTGAGANGGSFAYKAVIPLEVDTRDAFGVLKNMAANTQFILNLQLNTLANLYATAPTTPPQVTITASMEYYSAPAPTNTEGYPQATEPYGAGSLSLIQTQTPGIVPATQQSFQLVGVGNTIRAIMYILRDAAGVRTEVDWPSVTNLNVNNDLYFYKEKDLWRSQMAQEYGVTGGLSATPALNTLDNGVFILTDFMNSGESGSRRVDGASNRNRYLVTGTGTSLYTEAVNWGAAANSLLVVENVIKPATAQALYAPQLD